MTRPRTKLERDIILQSIFEVYPTKLIELDFETPFQLLTAVMLSAQMTDKGVNKATKRLFEVVKTPADLLKLEPEKVEMMLRGVNYYRVKTKHLFMTAKKLVDEHNCPLDFPLRRGTEEWVERRGFWSGGRNTRILLGDFMNMQTLDKPNWDEEMLTYLQTLPGVGVKTAKVVLSHLYDMPFIGVDTHIHRVMNRMGIVKTKNPEESDKKLEKLLTDEQKRTLHHSIVLFGRYVCTAKKCKCSETPLAKWCQCDQCKK